MSRSRVIIDDDSSMIVFQREEIDLLSKKHVQDVVDKHKYFLTCHYTNGCKWTISFETWQQMARLLKHWTDPTVIKKRRIEDVILWNKEDKKKSFYVKTGKRVI